MDVKIAESWKTRLGEEFQQEYFQKLTGFVRNEYKAHVCYPPGQLIFNAFDKCSFEDTRVVILGQDPYHGAGQANGLCFSVNDGVRFPPSLDNIFKEIHSDLGKPIPKTGNLERWAKQGVLLLNATLTVRANNAGSHQNQGWERFTDSVIKHVNDEKDGIVFMLWGRFAQNKGSIINDSKHFVLRANHPSPFSAHKGWFGSRHFSQANNYLAARGLPAIDW